ncbi:hypothetical protein T484DRAFT_1889615, partial [Baffinella frigidus]
DSRKAAACSAPPWLRLRLRRPSRSFRTLPSRSAAPSVRRTAGLSGVTAAAGGRCNQTEGGAWPCPRPKQHEFVAPAEGNGQAPVIYFFA